MKDNRDLLTKRQPKLRFWGFDDDLKHISLKDISIYKRGNGFNKNSIIECGENLVILYGHLFTLYKNNIDNVKITTNEQGARLSVKNSLLVPGSSTSKNDFFPFCSLDINNIYLGSDINIFEINSENSSLYLSYLFSNLSYMKKVWRLSEGTSVNHLYGEYISNIKIFLPTLDEQQKIAKFLALLDKQIELYVSKLALTYKYKLNYLNNLFSNTGIPKLRFRGFDDNLVSLRLGELINMITTGINPRKNFKLNEHGYNLPYITIKNIKENKIVLTNTTDHINNEIEKIIQERSKISNGDILFSSIGDIHNIGNSCIVNNYDGTWNINESLFSIKVNKLNNNYYVKYILDFMKKEIYKNATGGTFKSIKQKEFKNIILNCHQKLNEQQKIAKFLSLFDSKIDKIITKIKLMERFKKYYLNSLFI